MDGEEFRRLRGQMGLTQREYAERLGLHWNSVARMERGEMTISETVANLARLLAQMAKKTPKRRRGRS